MKSKSRRYEVLLPMQFNDGRDVPDELLGEAVNETVEQFGAVSFYKEAVEGRWRHDETWLAIRSTSSEPLTARAVTSRSNPR